MYKGYIKIVLWHVVVWTFSFSLFNFLREFGQEIDRPVEEIDNITFMARVRFQLILGLVSGVLFGSYQYTFDRFRRKSISWGRLLILGSLGYVFVITIFILIAFFLFKIAFSAEVNRQIIRDYFMSGEVVVPIVFCFIVGFFIEFFREVDKKFGPGNLRKMLTGQFYRPKEEERIFMFLDMRSSTTIAEQLGHIKYSRLIQDCFIDISIVSEHKAEIYQYVGDEVVLTWELEKGLRDQNCIHAYFAYADRLEAKREYFMDAYGLLPRFKAGMHMGLITVAEVGEIKREIAYHGDTINTAARIQSKCNEYGKSLLLSEDLLKALPSTGGWVVENQGEVELRGKLSETLIYSIHRRGHDAH